MTRGLLSAGKGRSSRVALLVSVGLFASIVTTGVQLAPRVPLPADGAGFTLAALRLGQPHLPYPIYTMLSAVFARLPLVTPAFGVNLLSIVASAGVAVLIYSFVYGFNSRLDSNHRLEEPARHLAAVFAAVFVVFSSSFWTIGVVAETYALNAFLTLAWISLLMLWHQRGRGLFFIGAVFAFSLSLGTNYLNFAYIPLLVLGFIVNRAWHRISGRTALIAIAVALLAIAQFLYVPLRPIGPPPEVSTFAAYWDFNLGAQIDGLLHFGSPSTDGVVTADHLQILGNLVFEDLGLALVFVLPGIGFWWSRRRRLAVLLGGVFLANQAAVFAVSDDPTLRADIPFFLIPSVLILGIAAGSGILALSGWFGRRIGLSASVAIVGGMAMILVGLTLPDHGRKVAQLADDAKLYETYSLALLESVPEHSVIVTDWTFGTSLWFYQYQTGADRSVEIIALWPSDWVHYIDRNVDRQATFVTHQGPEIIDKLPVERFLKRDWMIAYQVIRGDASAPGR